MEIYCCHCKTEVKPRLTTGKEIYPHRSDLFNLKFYKCSCGNYVGTHPNSTKPLGCIPTPELKKARQKIHRLMDPIWKSKKYSRKEVYKTLSEKLGYQYHTAETRSLKQIEEILQAIKTLLDILSTPYHPTDNQNDSSPKTAYRKRELRITHIDYEYPEPSPVSFP